MSLDKLIYRIEKEYREQLRRNNDANFSETLCEDGRNLHIVSKWDAAEIERHFDLKKKLQLLRDVQKGLF